ncbi:TPA: 50S ribosomal protein L24 [Patescibacteria group bacterium]|nr:50S ribosomal protein L24 [Patescibacteria group bacterium]
MNLKLKKGDLVKVVSGKEKGKQAKILKTFPKRRKLILENLFLVKKIRRPRKAGEKGEIINLAMPVSVSKVMLVCPSCNKAVRVGYSFKSKEKTRVCKSCGNKV